MQATCSARLILFGVITLYLANGKVVELRSFLHPPPLNAYSVPPPLMRRPLRPNSTPILNDYK